MQDNYSQFERRKQDHIELALRDSNQASELNVLDQFSLCHEALPDLDFSDIVIASNRFGRAVEKPFFVSSMTAGHRDAVNINHNLMEACAASRWAMGVGSQRRELTDPQAAHEWSLLRRNFPKLNLFSNLGIAQLIHSPIEQIQRLTDALEAEALIIHCNPLQEALQPEGTPQFKGCWQALSDLTARLAIPVVIKETGCGFSTTTLQRLNDLGIAAVDVSGLGGTHWGRIEGQRAAEGSVQQKAAISFRNWGIDTVQSVKNAVSIAPKFEIWGSGGVRHGLDAAKLFALGVSSVGFAKPMLNAALEQANAVFELMMTIEYELKVAMFCTGSRVLSELKEKACR
ncbi:type 2 isopentenyl-diphosphate Delta-isomerase [Legionella jordanis]|uniref:Isopentenyl-diphosphate delta-isomerase n=1 Tax=Legionella jordanis TaxID=456 RepID=A0A0W0VBJ3_9GAMM|nr:type 2 isopentenyl-diphosphate Delta-isomerase [Legionella jordanis]KTD17473.1 isopentenyl pyrophosphate isomerase [Legionella jordanis]RMX05187.1 type 2 isopentenyl-diphosphate Delta-isomerase [Legionella jordanis]RMX17443.1 type 2 isopentenyl-diphosphate Delta-isomerase [Legionella jordanis]VEH13442.1 isopentenyl-diphosphate delta-isomerase [Legionella jordanis]HAT8714361.1 type 2 isopentenyl-diphosphate Delta-isomerase [Legionella jordanis]